MPVRAEIKLIGDMGMSYLVVFLLLTMGNALAGLFIIGAEGLSDFVADTSIAQAMALAAHWVFTR